MNPTATIQELLASSSVPLLSAFLLGLLVALSPCPLATNLGALAYIGRQATLPGEVLLAGALYAMGRVASYTALASLLVLSGLEVSHLSRLLQDAGQYLLGPVLVLAGFVVLGFLQLPLPAALRARVRLGERLAAAGPAGALGLGALFALAFCPYSAALFFGVLLPLALGTGGGITLAPAFAVGTALPVLLAAVLLGAGVSGLPRWFDAATKAEPILRWGAGLVLVVSGLYAMASWL